MEPVERLMLDTRRKLLLLSAVVVLSAVTVSWLIYRSWRKENFDIKTNLKPDTYITTKIDDSAAPENTSPNQGVPDGYGVVTHADGSVYVGSFVNGKANGKGKITFPGGASYEGEFKQGLPDGKGVCTYSSGESQDCVFLLGQRQ